MILPENWKTGNLNRLAIVTTNVTRDLSWNVLGYWIR